MVMHRKIFLMGCLLAVAWGCPSSEAGLLSGKAAKAHLGQLQHHFNQGSYSVLLLARKSRTPSYLDPIDAIIFNTGGGTFDKKRGRDRDQIVLLDSPEGHPGERLTSNILLNYLASIDRNHMKPFVLQGKQGEELAVVFTDPHNRCKAFETEDGVRIVVEGTSLRPEKRHPIRFGIGGKKGY